MKIISDVILKNGVRITTFETADVSRPHCGEYCTMAGDYCKFCGRHFGYSWENDDENQLYSHEDLSKNNKKGLDMWM